jgi:EpsI family protein
MLSLLYGYLTYTSWLRRALVVVVTSAILILTNGVRAYIVMAVASATNLQYMGGRDHIYFGWLLFGIVMMSIMWIGARYADEENVASAAEPLAKSANSKSQSFLPMIIALGLMMLAVTVKPLQADFGNGVVMLAAAAALLVFVWLVSKREPATAGNKYGLPVSQRTVVPKDVFISIAGLAILFGNPLFVASIEADTMQPPDKTAYESVLGSGQAGEWKNTWRPAFNGAAFEYMGSFDYEAGAVNVYVAGYQSALQGAELISSSNQIIPPDWDRYVSYNEHQIRFSEELSPSIVEIIKTGSGSDSIVWYWYNIDSEITSSTVRAKFLQVLTMLRRRPAGGSVVVLETPLGQNAAQARQRLSRAAKELIST